MSFLRRLLGLGQGTYDDTDYVDPEFHFTLRIPGGWRQAALVPRFRSTGGRLALTASNGAVFNVSCGAPDPAMPSDKIARVERAREFLAQSVPAVVGPPLRDVTTPISGEMNVARAEISTVQGFHGLISILHEGIEYVLQYGGNERTRSQVEMLIASFCLPRTVRRYPARIVDFSTVVARLDAADEDARQRARGRLLQAGAESVPSILASVNACNQAIMAAAALGPQRMELGIRSLLRRIELLGELGDARGIPAILNAIGDSAKAKQMSSEAHRLLLVSQEALVRLGPLAVTEIAKVINTPSVDIRLALAEVLAKIGGTESQRVLQTMLDDPQESIRVLAQRATETFDFRIERGTLG